MGAGHLGRMLTFLGNSFQDCQSPLHMVSSAIHHQPNDLICNQALSHLPKAEQLQDFLAKYTPTNIIVGINDFQRLVLFFQLNYSLCSVS